METVVEPPTQQHRWKVCALSQEYVCEAESLSHNVQAREVSVSDARASLDSTLFSKLKIWRSLRAVSELDESYMSCS